MPGRTNVQKAREARAAKREAQNQRRYPKTPAAQLGSDAPYPEDEEDANEGAAQTDPRPNEPLLDEEDLGFGENIPNPLPNAHSDETAHSQSATRAMGAGHSREELSRDIRNASEQLQGEDKTAAASRKDKGKLKRPTPMERTSRKAGTGTVRQMPLKNTIRPSPYDELAGSPEKTMSLRRPPMAKPDFSPTKAQRKAQKDQAQQQAAPRRSARNRAHSGGQDASAPSKPADKNAQAAFVEAELPPDAIYRDRFPDYMAQQHAPDEVADAQVGAEEADAIEVASNVNTVQQQDAAMPGASAERAKRRGRPPKNSNIDASKGAGSVGPHMQAQADPKSAMKGGAPKTRPRSQPHAPARAISRLRETPERLSRGGTPQPPNVPGGIEDPAPSSTNGGSGRHQAALENLLKRRSGEISGDAAEVDAAPATDGMQLDEADDEEYLPDKPVVPKPVVPRISEVKFHNPGADDDESADADSQEAEQAEPLGGGKRKRKAPTHGAEANTGAKRRKTANPEDDNDEGHERHEANERRLWGQWKDIKKVVRDLREVGCNTIAGERQSKNNLALGDEDVKAIVELCKEAKKRYRNLMNGTSDDKADPAGVLQDIGLRADGLRGCNDDFPTDFHDKQKVTETYYHLIPALVKLTWRAITCYEAMDKDDVPSGEISMGHLRIVNGIIKLTLDLNLAAEKLYKDRPDTSDAVVRPVHNKIAPPLREIHKVFQLVLHRHNREALATARRAREAQDRALALEQEERRARQTAHLNKIRQKWEQLHRERMAAEGGLMPRDKWAHLRMPDSNLDEDFDGQPFSRVSVFQPRVGPPPGLLARAKEIVWTEGELRALEDGLQRYAGKLVLERTIRQWCPRGRMLNRYNVTEIVAAAEIVREFYVAQASEGGEEGCEEWIRGIPVWSNAHAAVGKENDGLDGGGGDEIAVAGAS